MAGSYPNTKRSTKDSPTPTTSDQRQRIMDYFGVGDLPVLHELAKHFTICDHWYFLVLHSRTATKSALVPVDRESLPYAQQLIEEAI